MAKKIIYLINSKEFEIPDGYHMEITTDNYGLKINMLVITNKNNVNNPDEVKERKYILSNVISFGDSIENCP
jgi:hypothetical protein